MVKRGLYREELAVEVSLREVRKDRMPWLCFLYPSQAIDKSVFFLAIAVPMHSKEALGCHCKRSTKTPQNCGGTESSVCLALLIATSICFIEESPVDGGRRSKGLRGRTYDIMEIQTAGFHKKVSTSTTTIREIAVDASKNQGRPTKCTEQKESSQECTLGLIYCNKGFEFEGTGSCSASAGNPMVDVSQFPDDASSKVILNENVSSSAAVGHLQSLRASGLYTVLQGVFCNYHMLSWLKQYACLFVSTLYWHTSRDR
nr:hypothetical protein Iba_chr07cCG10680 [Ipomoea batatas]